MAYLRIYLYTRFSKFARVVKHFVSHLNRNSNIPLVKGNTYDWLR
nr:MAG TPA: hypothetical protein [Caudoviricetes sp.]